MAEFDLGFPEAPRQVKAEGVGIFLSELQQKPEREIDRACGGKLHAHL